MTTETTIPAPAVEYSIDPVFEQVGKRRRLAGHQLTIDGQIVGIFPTNHDAEEERKRIAWDMLRAGLIGSARAFEEAA